MSNNDNNEDINPTYTLKDFENATKFATSNLNIRLLHRMYKKYPNIVSHLDINIRDATDSDYYIPPTLKHAAKVVELKFNDELCKLMSCNSFKEKTVCKETEEASYYYVGDSAYDLQCQPSCFFAVNPTYNEKKERSVDSYMLNWHNNKCKILPSFGVSWAEKTFYRSDVHYETRFNDMPTGFSRVKDDDKFSTGISYKSNEAYCKYFDRKHNSDDSCSYEWWENGLDAVLGMSLINSIKSGIRLLENGKSVFNPPDNLPKLPDKLPQEFTKEGWKNNIKADFKLPELIDTRPKLVNSTHKLLTSRHKLDASNENISTFTKKLIESTTTGVRLNTDDVYDNDQYNDGDDTTDNISHVKKRLKRSINDDDDVIKKTSKSFSDSTEKLKTNNTEKSKIENTNETNTTTNNPTTTDTNNKSHKKTKNNNDHISGAAANNDKKDWKDELTKMNETLLEILHDNKIWLYIAGGYAFDQSLKLLRKLLITIIEKSSTYIIKQIALMAGKVGTKVFLGSIRGVAIQALSRIAIQTVSKIAMGLAKIVSATFSVVTWIFVAAAFFDLILVFWDPAGYKRMHPPGYAKALYDATDIQLREVLGMSEPELTADFLIGSILTQDDMIECNIESFFDHLVYLDALTVNSDGSLLNKGPLIDLDNFNGNYNDGDFINKKNETISKRYHFNNTEFKEYNANFLKRINLNNTLNNINYVLIGFTSLFVLLNMKMLALFFLFIVLIIFVFIIIEARYNFIYDILKELNMNK